MNSFQKNSSNSLQQQKSNIHIDISFNFKTIIVGIFLPISDVIFVQNLAPSTHRIQSVQTCLRGLHTQTRLARSWYSRTDKRRRRSRSFRRVISPSCTPLVRGVALVICCNLVGTRWVSEMYRELKYRAENSVNFKARGETSSKKKRRKASAAGGEIIYRSCYCLVSAKFSCFYRVSSRKLRESRLASGIHRLPLEDDGFSGRWQLSRTVKKENL